jgi:hypothetical protein
LKPVDYVVFAIALCVCAVIITPMLAYIVTGTENTDEGGKLIAGLVASMIAIISIYVGARLRDKDE